MYSRVYLAHALSYIHIFQNQKTILHILHYIVVRQLNTSLIFLHQLHPMQNNEEKTNIDYSHVQDHLLNFHILSQVVQAYHKNLDILAQKSLIFFLIWFYIYLIFLYLQFAHISIYNLHQYSPSLEIL